MFMLGFYVIFFALLQMSTQNDLPAHIVAGNVFLFIKNHEHGSKKKRPPGPQLLSLLSKQLYFRKTLPQRCLWGGAGFPNRKENHHRNWRVLLRSKQIHSPSAALFFCCARSQLKLFSGISTSTPSGLVARS